MNYISEYISPIGKITIKTDNSGLVGICFKDQNKMQENNLENVVWKNNEIIKDTAKWLDIYFSGSIPDFTLPLHFNGTPFQISVWKILCDIKYGQTTTYGEIAKALSSVKYSHAVGRAVSSNKLLIVVPCHRVLGANGKLTGYVGGIERKIELLKIENSLQNTRN